MAAASGLLLLAAVLAGVLVVAGGPSRRAAAPPTLPAPPRPPAPAPPAGPPGQAPPGRELFGASVNRLFNDRAYTRGQIDAQLRSLRQSGATVARSDAFWEASEPRPPSHGVHHYDWRFDDAIAGSLAANDLRWLSIIDYSAPWAQSSPGQDHSPPSRPSDYASYAAALAARYGPGGAFWQAHPKLKPQPIGTYEIWNEPDTRDFWVAAPDPGRYAALYLRARDAILAADPRARVLVGGLAHSTTSLPAMVAAQPQLRGHIDGVAIHPYGATPAVVLANVLSARRTMAALGLGTVPLYVTEIGWTTHPVGAQNYVPERLRPSYISRTVAALGHHACGTAMVLLYTWVTPQRNRRDREDWFGIHPPRGGGSSDAAAFARGVEQARRGRAAQSACG